MSCPMAIFVSWRTRTARKLKTTNKTARIEAKSDVTTIYGAVSTGATWQFLYLKEKGFTSCNLGLVPMSGLEHPTNLSENLLKLAYERVPRFSGYKALRFFKEKFDPVWETQYVAYDSQIDLVNLPAALGRVVHEWLGLYRRLFKKTLLSPFHNKTVQNGYTYHKAQQLQWQWLQTNPFPKWQVRQQ